MTSNDLNWPQLTSKGVTIENVKSLKTKGKNSLKGGSVYKDIETNGEYLDETFHNKSFKIFYALLQIFSDDQTVRSDTVHF